jgi:16S rRNA (guanine527-N7)-methyltransferase
MCATAKLSTQLAQYLQQNAWILSVEQIQQLIDYVLLLEKWNRIHNLTSVRDPEQMLTKHLLDSLAIAEFVQGTHVLDVGSGAGLPGIPLAIQQPQNQFTLLDSNGKKTRFLTQVCQQLALPNVQIVQSRIEHFQPKVVFNTIVTRAFTSLTSPKAFVETLQPLLQQEGVFLLMKGQPPQDEITQINKNDFSAAIHPLFIHGLEATRHLLVIRKTND